MVENLEYKIVMDDGADTEVLGRVCDLDFGAAVYMAAVAKFSNRNIYLRQGERTAGALDNSGLRVARTLAP